MTITCSNCEGTGKDIRTGPSDNMDVYEIICEDCNGKGNIENDELRLHLEESFPEAKVVDVTSDAVVIEAPKEEWEALTKWLMNEFIPHDSYAEIHSLLKKINGQLAG